MYYFKSASLDLTYKCNLRCRHCYNNSGERPDDELNSDEVLQVAKEFSELEIESICICGGEPLLRIDDAISFTRYIKSNTHNTAVSMVSNGLLWNEAIAQSLNECGLDVVQFSLDGITDESYDMVRQTNGKLRKVFSAIEYAKHAGLRVMISSLPHTGSLSEFDRIIQFAVDSNLEELRVQPLMPLGRGSLAFQDLCLSEKQYCEIRKKLLGADADNERLKVEWGDPLDHFYMLQEVDYVPVLNIDAYGNILLSPYLPIVIWSLRNGSMREFINQDIPAKALLHPAIKEVLSDMLSVNDLGVNHGEIPVAFTTGLVDLTNEIKELKL